MGWSFWYTMGAMAVLKRVLRIAVPGVVGAFLIWQISLNWQEVGSRIAQANPWYLIAAFFANLTLYPLWVLIWYIILRVFGQQISYPRSFSIAIIANFAKYIPGLVWQYLGRVELAKRVGLPRPITITSLVYEVFAYIIAGLIWAILYFGAGAIWVALAALLLAILLLPRVVDLLRKRVSRLSSIPRVTLPWNSLVIVIFVTMLEFFSSGLALWLILLSLGQPGLNPFQLTSIYAVSWMIGYLTLIAPGGLGVADASLAGLLSPFIGIGLGSLVAVIIRLITFGNEVVLGLLTLKLWRKQRLLS